MASEWDGFLRELAEEIHVEGQKRCAICFWPLAESAEKGCIRGNCSMRGESGEYERKSHRAKIEADLTVLRAKLLPLLEAGQASEDLLESAFSHVSHGGPTRAQAEAAILMYRAARDAALKGSDK